MNWIIRNTRKLKFHTNLQILLEPIEKEIQRFKWLVSDIEVNSSSIRSLPINNEEDWFLISAEEMQALRSSDTQVVWGVFSAIDRHNQILVDNIILPAAEGAPQIWKNGNLQLQEAEVEIIAFDSSCTIVKFTDIELSDKFKIYFDDAIELEKYKWGK